jgi:hypothetical protein
VYYATPHLSTLLQVVNLETNKLVAVLGKGENSERFLGLSLYQGAAKVKLVILFDYNSDYRQEKECSLVCCIA